MARTVTVKLNGSEWHMPASYRASREVAEVVGDPVQMAVKSANGTLAWTQEDIISIIYIGMKHAGCGLSRDDVGEAIVDSGTIEMAQVAGEYIATMVAGAPERPVQQQKKTALRKVGSR
jgi:hypothetical protein